MGNDPRHTDDILGEGEWRNAKELLPLNLAALSYALDEYKKGVFELRENWSPEIEAYLKEANVNVPAPWCAGYVNWCARQAADLKGVHSPLEDVPLQAYVQSYYQHGKKNGWIIPATDAGPGDLFILWYNSLNRYGHIGFVEQMLVREGAYKTVEGNSNEAGSREGITIMRKKRTIGPGTKFLRWTNG